MASMIGPLDAEAVAARLGQARERIAGAARVAGRDPAEVELLLAGKYVSVEELGKLAEAGVRLIGENRAQELEAKVERWGDRFQWDFIGQLQSRKVKAIAPHARLIHSLASESAARALARELPQARPGLEVLIEVNVSGEEGKAGVGLEQIDALIELCPVPVTGLMTMPPEARDPEESRRWFSALRELAQARGLRRLSMGTSQDYAIAVEEGATIVRLGRSLLG
ncbi:MAG: YggS family pyridoxal phosphate-dependent enzyme [Solirubrobacteraceae bacterium]